MTLRVASGERVALMGPNGAGKTTLLHVLATASRPRAGSVRWYGTSVARKARRFIGAAPDTVLEEGGLTARQSTFFWCRQWMPRTVAGHLVDGVLQQFGLAPVADEPVSSFSFGMRRRLALAQALVHRPRLALLDEPTAGLDPEGVGALMAALAARAWQGHATIVASNDCDFVAASCDRVVFLDGGHLVEDASPKDLLARVGAARVAELEVAPSCSIDELRRVHGVGAVDVVAGIVRVELLDDRALARIVSVADGAGGELLALRVHTPNLGDAFHALTGARLDARPTVMRDAAATPSAAVVGS
jgi:ABC-2 type transport system ATP-binding protein